MVLISILSYQSVKWLNEPISFAEISTDGFGDMLISTNQLFPLVDFDSLKHIRVYENGCATKGYDVELTDEAFVFPSLQLIQRYRTPSRIERWLGADWELSIEQPGPIPVGTYAFGHVFDLCFPF
jgi:hypothetical protein